MAIATKQQRLVEYLSQRPELALADPRDFAHPLAWHLPPPRASERQVAERLLADAEFRALGLSRWLSSADGSLITGLVLTALPPPFRGEARLLVGGLKLAAQVERARGEKFAGKLALGVIVTFFVLVGVTRR